MSDFLNEAIKQYPTNPVSADLLDNITWDGLINNLRIAFVNGAKFKHEGEAVQFHDWCTNNGWFGNCKRINQDQSDYATTELLYSLFTQNKTKIMNSNLVSAIKNLNI